MKTSAKKINSKTSWKEKLEKHKAEGVDIPEVWQNKFGIGKMLIPEGVEVEKLIKEIPKGKLVTIFELRKKLATDFSIKFEEVKMCCPLVTGIFIRISAELGYYEFQNGKNGKKNIIPYWRVVKDDGKLFDKFPCGVKFQFKKLTEEGFEFEKYKSGKFLKVKNVENHIYQYT